MYIAKIGTISFDQVYGPKPNKKVKKESIFKDESVDTEDEYVDTEDQVFKVCKATDKNLVSGWASIAVQADGSMPLDWQGDIITTEVLEKAAIKFMEDYRLSGKEHEGGSIGTIVESIVFTKDKMVAMGIPPGVVPEGWFITAKVNDNEAFAKVKSGEYKMFSIQGKAKRLKV